jgi:hypothetical protein
VNGERYRAHGRGERAGCTCVGPSARRFRVVPKMTGLPLAVAERRGPRKTTPAHAPAPSMTRWIHAGAVKLRDPGTKRRGTICARLSRRWSTAGRQRGARRSASRGASALRVGQVGRLALGRAARNV